MKNAAVALVALSLILGVRFEPPWIGPSRDLAGLVLLLAAAPQFARRFRWPLAGVAALVALARLAERIALDLLGRPLDPLGDLPHVGAVASMLSVTLPVLALGALVALALGWSVGALTAAAIQASVRARGIAAVVALGVLAAGSASGTAATVRIARAPFAHRSPPRAQPPLPAAPDLGGADVVVIFVESYGVAALALDGLAPARERLAADARAGGFEFLSGQIQSPTFGGGSWRAHASLLSGVWIDSEARYRSLVGSDRESLARRFAADGYRTVAYEPGISGFWPEGGWYGFETIRDQPGIGWDGPPIGWWRIPDQYTLYALHRQELVTSDRPVFAKVSLIGSHIPYWPVPPYIAEWSRFDDQTAFEAPIRSVAHDDWRDLDQLAGRYVESLSYQLRIVGGFLRDLVPRRALVIVLGDHQPPRLALHDSDTWATPIHVFSQDPALLAPLRNLGFAEGLAPLQGSSWRMSDLPRDMSRLFPR